MRHKAYPTITARYTEHIPQSHHHTQSISPNNHFTNNKGDIPNDHNNKQRQQPLLHHPIRRPNPRNLRLLLRAMAKTKPMGSPLRKLFNNRKRQNASQRLYLQNRHVSTRQTSPRPSIWCNSHPRKPARQRPFTPTNEPHTGQIPNHPGIPSRK